MSSVHNLPKKISQIFPGNPVVGLQVVEQHVGADDQVTSVEGVDLIPTLKYVFVILPDGVVWNRCALLRQL